MASVGRSDMMRELVRKENRPAACGNVFAGTMSTNTTGHLDLSSFTDHSRSAWISYLVAIRSAPESVSNVIGCRTKVLRRLHQIGLERVLLGTHSPCNHLRATNQSWAESASSTNGHPSTCSASYGCGIAIMSLKISLSDKAL